HLSSAPGYSHHVLDANAEPACQIDSRLYSHNHAGEQPGCLSGADAWRLVNLQADTVAGGVGKCLRESLPAQNAAGGLIDLAATDPRAHCGHRRFLGLEHRLVRTALRGVGRAQVDGTGHIRAVTFEDNTEVEGQEAFARQRSLGSPSV